MTLAGHRPSPVNQTVLLSLLFVSLTGLVYGHDHHNDDAMSEENMAKSIDTILWLHIGVQILTWGFMFPIGMILGLARSKWHVPLQATAFALTIGGIFLGHAHKGRTFPETAHGTFADVVIVAIITQLTLGIYLKLHIHEKSIRPFFVIIHGIVGKSWPIIGWTQMLLGVVTLRGYCMGGATTQCIAHYIMGSAFIGYGILLALALYVGAEWLKRRGQSQEWFDSWVIFLWGIVNTFTEHHGSLFKWSHKDLQHTMLGVLWWTGGALGIYVSRGGRRSIVPAVIVMLTGWAMSAHEQQSPMSTKVHTIFGITLISAGVVRVIEITFILKDRPTTSLGTGNSSPSVMRSFQHLPPFLLVTGGILFMSATDEEINYIKDLEVDHVTYVLMMFSLAFLIYLYVIFLINLYLTSGLNATKEPAIALGKSNGYQHLSTGSIALESPLSGSRPAAQARRSAPQYPGVLHDAEAFELGDLEGDEDDSAERRSSIAKPRLR